MIGMNVVDVQRSGYFDETIRTLKGVMSVEPRTDEALYAVTKCVMDVDALVMPSGDCAGAGADEVSHAWDSKIFLHELGYKGTLPRVSQHDSGERWVCTGIEVKYNAVDMQTAIMQQRVVTAELK